MVKQKKTSSNSKVKKVFTAAKERSLNFAEAVRSNQIEKNQQTLINIENSTFLGILLRGAINNWFSILLVILLVGYSGHLYLKTKELENEALKVEVKRLNSIVDSNSKINEDLKIRIKELEDKKKLNSKENNKYRDSLRSLTSEVLKEKILMHVKRLKKVKGIKN